MAVATNWFDSHSFLYHQPIYNEIYIVIARSVATWQSL